ncbi:MAG: hypothetical protein JNM31_04740 [Flavobacteriales bacterium]|nr:hypothetical protein [Flavobacteriales bacterium]
MERQGLLFSILLLLVTSLPAQDYFNYAITPGGATRSFIPFDLGAGNSLNVCDRAYGYDSSRVEFVWTAPDQTVTDAVSYRLQTALTFLNHAAPLDDGYLVAGGNNSTSFTWPFLFKTSLSGVPEWYVYFSNLANQQTQIMRILPRGSDYSVYTYPGGTYAPAIYRIDGELTGSTFGATLITSPANVSFRAYESLQLAAPLEHLLCGTANDNSAPPANMKAMLMKVDASGGAWMKLYDMGGPDAAIEDMYAIQPTSDGNYLCTGYYTTGGSSFEGYVMKVDAAGAVLWCRTYTDVSGGLWLFEARETFGGSIIVSGQNGAYQGMLLHLNGIGDPMETLRFPADRLRNFIPDGNAWKLIGLASLIGLDPDGYGCDFLPNANVTATTMTPTVTSVPLTNAPFTPVAMPFNHFSRTPTIGWTQTCIWNGLAEHVAPAQALRAFPVPSDATVYLESEGPLRGQEEVIVRDLRGAVVMDVSYGTGLDMRQMASGMYVAELPRTGQHVLLVRR